MNKTSKEERQRAGRPLAHRSGRAGAWILRALGLAGLCLLAPLSHELQAAEEPDPPPQESVRLPRNIVLFLADDQRVDTLGAMPHLDRLLRDPGVTFTNAYVMTPLCSPSRASLLSGGFRPDHCGVIANGRPSGGMADFPEEDTLAVRLQEAGWKTAWIGKYLNGYEALLDYIPPGWSRFVSFSETRAWDDFDVVSGSSGAEASQGRIYAGQSYITDFQAEQAVRFIEDSSRQPFFLVVSFVAPHHPSTPALEDEHTFDDFQSRGASYNEADVSDKPSWVRNSPLIAGERQQDLDLRVEASMECLPAMDRAVQRVWESLREHELLDDTVLIYTSDNGLLWGEHRIVQKNIPYREAVGVPLVIAAPKLALGPIEDRFVSADMDIAATIQELAGLPLRTEGKSLAGLLFQGTGSFRSSVLIQGWPGNRPVWAGLVTREWTYIEHGNGERELYDRAEDPFEENSLHMDETLASEQEGLAAMLDLSRGLAITTHELPEAREGEPYTQQLESWGGEPPFTWAAVSSTFPEGLELSTDGAIVGTPYEAGVFHVQVRIEDSSASPWNGEPAFHMADLTLIVQPAGCACGTTRAGGLPLLALALLLSLARARRPPKG